MGWSPDMEWPYCADCTRPMQRRVRDNVEEFVCAQCPVLFRGAVVDKITRYEC